MSFTDGGDETGRHVKRRDEALLCNKKIVGSVEFSVKSIAPRGGPLDRETRSESKGQIRAGCPSSAPPTVFSTLPATFLRTSGSPD
jgi:hypothetical protein